jgi:hypothetical protein
MALDEQCSFMRTSGHTRLGEIFSWVAYRTGLIPKAHVAAFHSEDQTLTMEASISGHQESTGPG